MCFLLVIRSPWQIERITVIPIERITVIPSNLFLFRPDDGTQFKKINIVRDHE